MSDIAVQNTVLSSTVTSEDVVQIVEAIVKILNARPQYTIEDAKRILEVTSQETTVAVERTPRKTIKGRYNGKGVDKNSVGYMIGKARAKKGYTLKQLADRLGVAGGFIGNIEGGRSPLPFKHIETISTILGLDSQVVAQRALCSTKAAQKLFKKLKNK